MTDSPVSRTVTQYAIRTEGLNGVYHYRTHSEYGVRNPPPSVPLTYERAVEQTQLYREDCHPTVMSRTVVIIEDPWKEVTE